MNGAIKIVTVFLSLALLSAADEPPVATQPAISELRNEKIDTAERCQALAIKQYQAGLVGFADVDRWTQRVLQSKLATASTREKRINVLAAHLENTKAIELSAQQRFKVGFVSELEWQSAKYSRIEAEMLLAEEKQRS